MRQRHFANLAALLLVERNRLLDRRADLRVETFAEIFFRNAQLPRTATLAELGAIVRDVGLVRGGIAFVVARNRVEHDRGVLGGPRKRPNLIERRGIGHEAEPRHKAVGGLETDETAQRGRLANRASGVGAKRRNRRARRERRRAAA